MTSDDDLLADVEFDLIDESDPPPEDVFARQTAIPAAPPEQLAADIMLQAESAPARPQLDTIDEGSLTPPPVRAKHLTPATLEPPPSEDLEFDSFDAPIDVFGDPLPGTAPERPPGFGQSEVPTAPPVSPAKSPRPHAPYAAHSPYAAHAPSPPGRSPSVEKLTQPVRPRERPAFMVETTRNRPPSPEMLARATPRSGAQRGAPHIDAPPDSALDFVQGMSPAAASVQPVTGRQAPAPAPPARAGVRELEECYAVGDYTRALQIAEQMLARSPDDVAARRYAQNCRDVLTQMFAARIGPLDQIITVVVSPQEVQWLALDHRAGFLLSLVDGQSTVDEILDISGMTRLDALKILNDLTEQQVVKLA
ncbi:MAG: hypothetical protein RL685_6462 [Pseudomonadota bacterium]